MKGDDVVNHLSVYMNLWILRNCEPVIPEHLQLGYAVHILDMNVDSQLLARIVDERFMPKNPVVSRYLDHMGYSREFIKNVLGVSQPTVSRHLNKGSTLEDASEYVHPLLHELQKQWRTQIPS